MRVRDRSFDTARISADGVYRYTLSRCRILGLLAIEPRRVLGVCGLNPSTADAEKPDQTTTKDVGFAELWGCDTMWKVNAEAFRTKDPSVLKAARRAGVDTIGPENDAAIAEVVELVRSTGGIFLIAWGNHITPERQQRLAEIIGDIAMCLDTNDNGTPMHELYAPYSTHLKPWHCPPLPAARPSRRAKAIP